MLLVSLVLNKLSNYGRRHFKLFTKSCFVGHPVSKLKKPLEITSTVPLSLNCKLLFLVS